MDADRELFIQQLVAALHENSGLSAGISSLSLSPQSSPDAIDGGTSSDSAGEGEKVPQEYTGLFLSHAFSLSCANSERLAQDAYVQLQFDYPQVQDASIEALAELYRRISAEKSTWQIAADVPITSTLLNNVTFLNDHSPSSGNHEVHRSQSVEAGGLLAASLLLLLFRMCLETPEDKRVDVLLSSLVVKQLKVTRETNENGIETLQGQAPSEDELVEKFAAQEDPDDLSEVYEGCLPPSRSHCLPMWRQRTAAISTASKVDKLRDMALSTFSSSFESVSMAKWEQWRLDDNLVAIMKLLVSQHQPPSLELTKDTCDAASAALYGPQGEWTRYLYIMRDRVLRFPSTSRHALWRLKELIAFLQQQQSVTTTASTLHRRVQQPQHVIYRVLAELAISPEFHQNTAQRAQQGLTLVIQELIPFIVQEVHKLGSVSSITSVHQTIVPANDRDSSENDVKDDDEDDELAVVILQLLHFIVCTSPNPRTTIEKLHESGMLRTLFVLLPSSSDSNNERHAQLQPKRWFPALLRLFGECALWHAGFAAYIARVPKFVKILPTLREQLVVEELLLALAFHQHQVAVQSTVTWVKIDIWKVFTSESLFPLQCESYLDAMKKLQDTVFIMDCLEQALTSLRPAVQKELQRSLEQIYSTFTRSFEYPTFAAAEASRQQQRVESMKDPAPNDDSKAKEEERGHAEVLQFTALRNKLRQSVKSMLAALFSGSAMAHVGGRVSSKLD